MRSTTDNLLELRAREEIRNSISCLHVAEIVAANFRGADVSEVERWRNAGRVLTLGELAIPELGTVG